MLHSDASFVVWSDDAKLGELQVSKGSIDWLPGNGRTRYRMSWEKFNELMKVGRATPRERATVRRICARRETDDRNYCNAFKMHLDDLAEGVHVRLGSDQLPPGRLVRPRLNSPILEFPVLWATDEAVERPGVLWQELTDGAPQSGLVPIILDDLPGSGTPSGRPWDSGEFDPQPLPRPDDLDEAVVFRQRWNMGVPISLLAPEDRPTYPGLTPRFIDEDIEDDDEEREMFLEQVAPWGVGFPGLALAERTAGDPDTLFRAVRETPAGRIGLVETSRSADVPYVIGWMGAVNHFISETGATPLSLMMRSWEERFAARLFRLGFATMTFCVGRPPSTESGALALAAEHFAFAGTDGFQAYEPPLHVDSIRSLANVLFNRPSWSFWFD